MNNIERKDRGMIYDPNDKEIQKDQLKRLCMVQEYNSIRPDDISRRKEMLRDMFASFGEGSYIEQPFYANLGGKYVHIGSNVYANFHLTLVDDGNIYIGDNTMMGPNVTIATASHTIEPELRRRGLQFNKDVHIGKNVWIGSGVTVLPGVTIGDNTVIGANSVVTRDIKDNVLAFGNPCRVIREIDERDRECYYKDEKIDMDNIKKLYKI